MGCRTFAPPRHPPHFCSAVYTDPVTSTSVIGNVFEGTNERNNARSSEAPVIIELPPPTDIEITDITFDPSLVMTGEPVQIQWTVTNQSDQAASGVWSDTVFLSDDATWSIDDRPLGRVQFSGSLGTGDTYTSTLTADMPPVIPGQYRVIVRADVFNQLFEDTDDANNITASPNTLDADVQEVLLSELFDTTLSMGQQRLLKVNVPVDQTLRVTLRTDSDEAANELFLRHEAAPTGTVFDASYEGGLQPSQTAIIPSTQPGVYYILLRGFTEPQDDQPVTVLAELLPLTITDVHTDVGGSNRWVTTTIQGARFHEDAIVKLVRPGFAEFEPSVWGVIDSTKIIATFDLTDAPHGLYDLKVINPDGQEAIIPYRFLVERAIQPEVTIGIGGPRAILAGDVGTYSVALQSLTNIDTPYVSFDVGVPEMGLNEWVYDLPFSQFFSNVGGIPPAESLNDIPWASLDSAVNTDGHNRAPGYLFDEHADGFTGFNFNVATYPGLRELHDQNFEEARLRLNSAIPGIEDAGILDIGPAGLGTLNSELLNDFLSGTVPDPFKTPFIPFQFHVTASATAMTRKEFVDHQLTQAQQLREAIIADPQASSTLLALAADEALWGQMFLASLEEAGLLRPEGDLPPIREHPLIVSRMATLASGILAGPAGSEIQTTGNLVEFFEQIRTWYGHTPGLEAPTDGIHPTSGNPIPVLPQFEDVDLGLTAPTHFEAFRVYVPWVPFESRGSGLPTDFQISGVRLDGGEPFVPLDFSEFFEDDGSVSGLASLVGPFTTETNGFVPANEPLPFTVHFQNDPLASTQPGEIRVVTDLDDDLDPRTFRLGDIRVGDINVHVPQGRGLFQGDFDFTQTKGFILRVSAGIDLVTNQATWLIQAIDPLTGELVQDPANGLLPPNNAAGNGAGFVTYTIEPVADLPTGTQISAKARVLFNTAAPEDTFELTYELDGVAPTTQLTAERLNEGSDNYLVRWDVTDDPFGSGFKHVTLYVATDGGDFEIWQRQLIDSRGMAVFEGESGRTYEFLALATDISGNREPVPFGVSATDDGSTVNLGALPTVPETTPPNFGIAPQPTPQPSTSALFTEAEQGIPAADPVVRPSEFDTVLRPFTAMSFVTGISQSHADIGPMAIAEVPDGDVLVSGGASRSDIYRFDGVEGGQAATPWAQLDHPIFNLAFDEAGNLWATTGGGPLLQLDPANGRVINEYGDGLTIALAIEPGTGLIYVSSGQGVEVFDPATEQFTHFSRDLDLRVGSLAFAPDGSLWAVTWPDRRQVVRFDEHRRVETMFQFDSDIDSLAFGQSGTALENLLFVSHNAASQTSTGDVESDGSDLTMIDTATLRRVSVAQGGSRGDVVITTSDGRVLLSQSSQVDVLNPIVAPVVVATNPPNGAVAALPLPFVSVVFDQDMFVGDAANPASVVNLDNYVITSDTAGNPIIRSVVFDPDNRTALLTVEGFVPGDYQLTVSETLESANGVAMASPFITQFTAASDFSAFVDITFADSRTQRVEGSVSYEVTVTNTGDFDLLLPFVLLLDPAQGFDGVPQDVASQDEQGRWLIDLSADLPQEGRLRPGQSTTAHTVTVHNPDDLRVDFDYSLFTLPTVNEAPEFVSGPVTIAEVGQDYTYQAQAQDPDGVAVAYFLYHGPEGMTVDLATGLVQWTPSSESSAQTDVILHAYDTRGGRGTQQYTIDVAGGNHSPSVEALPPLIEAGEGEEVLLTIQASDLDGDELALWVNGLPPGAEFDSATRTFRWTPDFDSAGSYEGVTFVVSDGVQQASTSTTFLISQTDRGPTLAQPADRVLQEGDRLRLTFDAADGDGDPLIFSSDALPDNAILDPNTGVFDWTVGLDQAGVYDIPFTVTSGGVSVTQTATLTVLNTNAAPVFDPLAGFRVFEGQEARL